MPMKRLRRKDHSERTPPGPKASMRSRSACSGPARGGRSPKAAPCAVGTGRARGADGSRAHVRIGEDRGCGAQRSFSRQKRAHHVLRSRARDRGDRSGFPRDVVICAPLYHEAGSRQGRACTGPPVVHGVYTSRLRPCPPRTGGQMGGWRSRSGTAGFFRSLCRTVPTRKTGP